MKLLIIFSFGLACLLSVHVLVTSNGEWFSLMLRKLVPNEAHRIRAATIKDAISILKTQQAVNKRRELESLKKQQSGTSKSRQLLLQRCRKYNSTAGIPHVAPRKFPVLQPGDLGIRFSKVVFKSNIVVPTNFSLPLRPEDFPIDGFVGSVLKQSQCPSVMTPDDYEMRGIDIEQYIELVGGYPEYPSSNSSGAFWNNFREVVKHQIIRKNDLATNGGTLASAVMDVPDIWSGYTIHDAAEAVHNEYPGSNQVGIIKVLLGPVLDQLNLDHNIVPWRSNNEFLRGAFLMAELNTWSTSKVGPVNFSAKYHVGQPRPEEIAWKIAQGNLTEADGVPKDIVDDILSMNLRSQFDFTAYPEGSPRHPSWPAMHSAVSCASLWLAVVLNLTDEQWRQAKLMDWAVSYARTVAGVHYPSDNLAGLNIGQEVIANRLADFLVDRYGVNRATVEAKIARFRFDWREFEPSKSIL